MWGAHQRPLEMIDHVRTNVIGITNARSIILLLSLSIIIAIPSQSHLSGRFLDQIKAISDFSRTLQFKYQYYYYCTRPR